MLIRNNLKKIIICFFITLFFYKVCILEKYIFKSPIVSIIIPASNRFNYTYKCIKSIFKAEHTLSFEVIIINETFNKSLKLLSKKYLNKYRNNILHMKKKDNNIIKNFNKASKLCKGKYLMFLSDFTKVYDKSITYLIKQLEQDEKIGLIGSKIIFSNKTLKEAGGIICNNGEKLSYGKGDDANKPEYNYIKEVDFISGISFITRKSLWEKFGGLDEKFIQISYADVDLAFSIRKYEYKVIYQPKSLIKNYDNNFNKEKDLNDLENINKNKFIEKWKDELKYQSNENDIYIARDRSYNKSMILVIDRYVPNFDKDAGGRFCYMYLNIFKEIGLKVTFLGDNLKIMEPYTSILQQKGIEVLYGNSYKKDKFETWLKNNIKYYKYIYLQRPAIAEKYFDLIKKNYSGKILYFPHDLHFIRLSREFNISHNITTYELSKMMEKMERDIFNKVDIIHVVGSYEYNILKKEYKNKTIRNIPLYIYDKQITNIEKDFSKRKNLIFVGGFEHAPNVDAILWFSKEIYPKIIQKFPNIKLHIISSKVPETIKKLNSTNIDIKGFLNDKELYSIYQKCRLAIAPLRYGAGVKGKVIEAAYNQIPMVTTTIGGEGIDKSTGAFIIEDNPKKMAELISNLYIDYTKLKQMSDSGKILIEKYYSKNRAKKILLKDIIL